MERERPNPEIFRREILPSLAEVPLGVEDLCAQWDEGGHLFVNVSAGGYGLVPLENWDPAFVEALLNSRLLSWVLRRRSRAFANGWFAARKGNLKRLPIALGDVQSREGIIDLFHRCRDLRAELEDARTDHETEMRGRVLRAAVDAFDAAVEDLYEVSDGEKVLLRQA